MVSQPNWIWHCGTSFIAKSNPRHSLWPSDLWCGDLNGILDKYSLWWHQMESFSALLAICVWNSLVTGEFPAQRRVTRSFDVFFDLSLNRRLSKQWWGWWFETPSRPIWRVQVMAWHQAITLSNVEPVLCLHMVSLGHNVLTTSR